MGVETYGAWNWSSLTRADGESRGRPQVPFTERMRADKLPLPLNVFERNGFFVEPKTFQKHRVMDALLALCQPLCFEIK